MASVEGSPLGLQELVQAVHVEGRVPGTKEDPFPKVVGRTRSGLLLVGSTVAVTEQMEAATLAILEGQRIIACVDLGSVSSMDMERPIY